MKNSIWILLYLFVLVLIVFFEYQSSSHQAQHATVYPYKIEKNEDLELLFKEYSQFEEENISLNNQWGIVIKKVQKVKEVNLSNEINSTKVVEVTLKKSVLCIEKECFRLLGIFKKGKYGYASFYNKNSKQTVKEFAVGERVDSSIKIKSIKNKTIVFSDLNSTREWSITLFDVNSSKYKPKELEE